MNTGRGRPLDPQAGRLRYAHCMRSLAAAADGHKRESALVSGFIGSPWTARTPAGYIAPGPRVIVAAPKHLLFPLFAGREGIDPMQQAAWETARRFFRFEWLSQRAGNLEMFPDV